MAKSRTHAHSLIISGLVRCDGRIVMRPSFEVSGSEKIEISGDVCPYVSRGGLKLEKAMASFPIALEGCTCADIGASTGGFTDCMLQNGAAKVYAVDVGYGQLAWSLRNDPRVVCLERTNARYLTDEQVPEPLDFVSIDVSFISLRLILPAVHELLKARGHIVCLVKPQFEAGREKVGKKGVVRDKAVHLEVIEMILQFVTSIHFEILNLDYSPIKGPEGNIEYLVYIRKRPEDYPLGAWTVDPAEVVDRAHEELAKG